MEYKELIINQINRLKVISATQIALNIMSAENPHLFKKEDFDSTLEKLIESGDVTFLYFTPPEGGTGTLYFPKGTTFDFNPIKRVRPKSQVKRERIDKYGEDEGR